MRHPATESGFPSSWVGWKDRGKWCYDREDFEGALESYKAALGPDYHVSRQDRQILLSNIVACRLKIGGPAHSAAAVDAAKQCVELNPSWAKGHVRLASAYIALGGHSNDACNELQTALRLDPGNGLARQLLVRELRRDHAGAAAMAAAEFYDLDNGGPSTRDRSSDDIDNARDPPTNPNYQPTDQYDARVNTGADDLIDDSVPVVDRIRFFLSRAKTWYNNQSSDVKTIVKALVVVLLLYIGFGGRFGLDSLFTSSRHQRGNYGAGNAYDRYRTTGRAYQQQSYHTSRGYESSGGYTDYGNYRSSGSSFGLSDGTIPSIAILLGVAYLCHLNGINPLHAMWMMNAVGGRRRRMRGFGRGFGGPGMMWGYGGARIPRRRARW